jgi:hypothetical protein
MEVQQLDRAARHAPCTPHRDDGKRKSTAERRICESLRDQISMQNGVAQTMIAGVEQDALL